MKSNRLGLTIRNQNAVKNWNNKCTFYIKIIKHFKMIFHSMTKKNLWIEISICLATYARDTSLFPYLINLYLIFLIPLS